jgi:hypothetical protein
LQSQLLHPIQFVVLSMLFAWNVDDAQFSAQDAKPKPALSLELTSLKDKIRTGTPPAFRLTIENIGKADEKILKPRGDLQDTYYDLIVTKDGKALTLG